ncbi:hypothetical protein EAY64_05510 [Aquitalea palustris]|uniref:Uncharacterized protein n=1 Tax=Aquitalea palustris TaxID=2480983 RepID=A0A454JKX7_9NEIS|nr:hypothetical protein [Aquitalea palustris]RMD00054.1 hypothetical protein EAY64_05510 [Aquitalea palustris]
MADGEGGDNGNDSGNDSGRGLGKAAASGMGDADGEGIGGGWGGANTGSNAATAAANYAMGLNADNTPQSLADRIKNVFSSIAASVDPGSMASGKIGSFFGGLLGGPIGSLFGGLAATAGYSASQDPTTNSGWVANELGETSYQQSTDFSDVHSVQAQGGNGSEIIGLASAQPASNSLALGSTSLSQSSSSANNGISAQAAGTGGGGSLSVANSLLAQAGGISTNTSSSTLGG